MIEYFQAEGGIVICGIGRLLAVHVDIDIDLVETWTVLFLRLWKERMWSRTCLEKTAKILNQV